ncbi:MAG: dihydroorotate dehydrogenase [Actinobacteria bacterium]|nr:dihydroorotate dehydrogenase [Actinomycetota bacterium]MSZ95993.1 dihydroorotate dehydrogenase [Actinomycetota bacterium]
MRRGASALEALGEVEVGGVVLANPFMTASGTSGHDVELGRYMPLHRLGAVVVKSLFHELWEGNPAPRVHVAQSGMMNAVGLQGPGVVSWCDTSLPLLEQQQVTVVASIWGRSVREYVLAAEQLQAVGNRVAAIEVNLSCPNLEGRSGIIAHDPSLAGEIVAAVSAIASVPVWAKLSANTDRIVQVATTVIDAGASSLTLINTMLGMQIDIGKRGYTLGNGGGGLSGPAIHPIAVRAVHDVRSALPEISIVGVGGIASGADAVEMMMAGANAVQVGTASFARPDATWRIACDAANIARQQGASTWSDIVNSVHR